MPLLSTTADMATYTSDGRHLPLNAIKEELRKQNKHNVYIFKEIIPTYPRPELHVANVSHSTDLRHLQGIKADGGFKSPETNDVVWFSLTASPDELQDAETREMTLVHPGGREQRFRPLGSPQGDPQATAENRPKEEEAESEVWKEEAKPEVWKEETKPEVLEGPPLQRDSLLKFASSPAFKPSSKFGSFRFTFSLRNVLDKYKQQFCGGQEPVFRVWGTKLYKQEVVYAVLVHSPDDPEEFSQLPLLEKTSDCICAFEAGSEFFVWRPQAMSETHWFQLEGGNLSAVGMGNHQFYVWDHMALALYVGQKLLTFEDLELRENLRFCEMDYPPVSRAIEYQEFGEAQAAVKNLWPDQEHLQRFNESQFNITE